LLSSLNKTEAATLAEHDEPGEDEDGVELVADQRVFATHPPRAHDLVLEAKLVFWGFKL
jgi:hypothetical protein